VLTLGEFVQFYLYLAILTFPFRSIGMLIGSAQRAVASGQRVFEILDTEPQLAEPTHPVPLPAGGGHVRMAGITFGYDPAVPVLHDLDLDIPAGRTVAIIGPTGSGKSTITQLIPRFYDPQAGTVTVDGVDVRDVAVDDIRGAVGMVTQDPFLFSDTVRANIAFGRPEASDEDVAGAARMAQADTFIRALPEGYDTVVGERGFTLSGGQRQRIAIARAILVDPRILVLDEATASVDASTEREISRALATVMAGRTTIIIAHRLSTIALAEEIVLIDDGRVAARGTHDDLYASSALYREIHDQGLARPDELVAREG
jgi:ATP-binding cassette subfamily B protein